MKKRRRQFYFSRRELQISLALIVLVSFATVIFLAFVIREAKDFLEILNLNKNVKIGLLILVFVCYVVALAVLTSVFTHRFIGPFPRLKRELQKIREGQYEKRLSIRTMDDPYIRSFIDEINGFLDLLEEKKTQDESKDK
ncbi:hypothetical protein BMS3Abin07_01092 [bacterium BMS3Abin07]|nr:hypothetical protein BMS3Abin07_01092 [bacterium BMS3Abin07]GBE31915.1 hypothetical protein BMS3Bbin05_00819 [bacterium BMS3Bbin05]HDL20484.1 hypothetical protein [Nitrospirota bacterium]HDO23205.1 hypothetical protein [Nitrospirota bacterium]HDZ87113.1 hypothetical protein [Nitrospirota bacterium]